MATEFRLSSFHAFFKSLSQKMESYTVFDYSNRIYSTGRVVPGSRCLLRGSLCSSPLPPPSYRKKYLFFLLFLLILSLLQHQLYQRTHVLKLILFLSILQQKFRKRTLVSYFFFFCICILTLLPLQNKTLLFLTFLLFYLYFNKGFRKEHWFFLLFLLFYLYFNTSCRKEQVHSNFIDAKQDHSFNPPNHQV